MQICIRVASIFCPHFATHFLLIVYSLTSLIKKNHAALWTVHIGHKCCQQNRLSNDRLPSFWSFFLFIFNWNLWFDKHSVDFKSWIGIAAGYFSYQSQEICSSKDASMNWESARRRNHHLDWKFFLFSWIQWFFCIEQNDLSWVCSHLLFSILSNFLSQNNLVVIYFSFAYAGVNGASNIKSLVCGKAVDISLHVELSWAAWAETKTVTSGLTQDRTHEISYFGSVAFSNSDNFSKGLLIIFFHWGKYGSNRP